MRRDVVGRVGGAHAAAIAVDATPQPVAASVGTPARLGYVDGLRALAALYVVVSHIMSTIWPFQPPSGLVGLLTNPLGYAHYAVSVFIVLSGFSLMLPVARKDYQLPWGAWGFYWRRARRILPPYYFAMGLTLLLIWLFIGQKMGGRWYIALPVTGKSVIEHILLLQDLSRTQSLTINFAFWSIAMECQIYLLFPALTLLWRRYPPLFSTLLVVICSLLLLFGLELTWVGRLPGYTGTEFAPQYIGLFAMGMFAASVYTRPTPRWLRLRDWYLWEALALLCFGIVVLRSAAWPLYLLDLFVGVATIGLLLAAARPGRINPIRAGLEWRPLVWIGGFSYSIYLIHAPLVQLLWQYGLHPLGLGDVATYLALLAAGLPLIVLASWGFFYVCERPFLNSRNSRAAGPGPGAWLARLRSWRAA